MITALLLVPFLCGLLCFMIRRDLVRRVLLVSGAGTHTLLTAYVWTLPSGPLGREWLAIDDLGKLFLGITSLIFFMAAIYCAHYLKGEKSHEEQEWDQGFFLRNAPEAVFTGCLFMFLASMTLVTVSRHLGILWVAMEATTLASAPLIYFHRHHRSLEATWKYLLICSVGIALAMLGNLFLAAAGGQGPSSLLLNDLLAAGKQLNVPWLKAAFIFLFIGYGTKMGLAPLHTWLPDAHSEAPSVVSALLSGALLNCAFVSILRGFQVCAAAGLDGFCREIFILFGIISIFFAAVFILGQADYKRMLAYSSIEHMGILSLGLGLGKGAVWGAMFHAVNHSFTKAALFFVAGNILGLFRSKSVRDVQGVFKVLPRSGMLWLAGFFSITGFPPSGTFLSKLVIFKAGMDSGHYILSGIFLSLLCVIFIGALRIFVPMAQGLPPENIKNPAKAEADFSILPSLVLLGLVFVLGFHVPRFLNDVLTGIAQMMETHS